MIIHTHKKRGLALVELLVALSIISVLVSITYASLRTARARAEDARTLAEVQQIKFAMEVYYQENGGYPNPCSQTDPPCSNSPTPDQVFCIGSECIYKNINHTAIPPLAFNDLNIQPKTVSAHKLLAAVGNIIPTFNLQNLPKHVITLEGETEPKIYQGYFYTCTHHPDDPPAIPPVNPTKETCVGTARMYYILHNPLGAQAIQEYIFGSEAVGSANSIPGSGDCPDPTSSGETCTGGDEPPGDVPETDPYNGGSGGSGT